MNAFSENKTVLKLEANIFFSSMTNAPKVEGKKNKKHGLIQTYILT